jgi:hypothetical protein
VPAITPQIRKACAASTSARTPSAALNPNIPAAGTRHRGHRGPAEATCRFGAVGSPLMQWSCLERAPKGSCCSGLRWWYWVHSGSNHLPPCWRSGARGIRVRGIRVRGIRVRGIRPCSRAGPPLHVCIARNILSCTPDTYTWIRMQIPDASLLTVWIPDASLLTVWIPDASPIPRSKIQIC